MRRKKQKLANKKNFKWDITCQPNSSPPIEFKDVFSSLRGESSDSQKEKFDNLLHILHSLNFKFPSPIQREAIPLGIKGNNLIAQSQSGTGKTITFLSLIFTKIEPDKGLQGLIITPTRELADQIFNLTMKMNSFLQKKNQIKVNLLIGGMPLEQDLTKFKQGNDLIIGTTGRVMLHFQEKNIFLERLRLVLIDEADILLKGREFRKLFGAVRHEKDKRKIQICCFSATFGRKNLLKYCRFLYPCVKIHNDCYIDSRNSRKKEGKNEKDENFLKKNLQEVNLDNLDQFYVEMKKSKIKSESLVKLDWVVKILKMINFEQCIIFYNDKGRGDQIIEELK